MKKAILLLVILSILSNTSAATEYATFESFYTESIGWDSVIWSLIGAAVIGAIVYLTGGLGASALTTTIGSTIGEILGYSGAVATKVGLAFLGGGAIANGGFGIVGGTVLITAALDFSTNLIIGYSIENYTANYNKLAFIEQSKNMVNLPLPIQSDGSQSYEVAIKMLQRIDKEQPLASSQNRLLLQRALEANERSINNELLNVTGKKLQLLTFKSLLHSSLNDYTHAKETAEKAIRYAKQYGYKSSLPEFIYALATLYDEKANITEITELFFKKAILTEPDNLLIPIAFTAYLDRIIYRYTTNDSSINETHINQVAHIAAHHSLRKYGIVNLSIIMVRYFTLLKFQQQNITVIATSTNDTIKNSPQAVKKLNVSFTAYTQLLADGKNTLNILLHQSLDDLRDEQRQKVETELRQFRSLMSEYEKDEKRLATLITSTSVP